MSIWQVFLFGWAIVALMMFLLWLIQLKTKDASHVDVGWAYGLPILAGLYAWQADGDEARRILLAICVAVWGFRLGTYLLLNRVIGKPEDGRYVKLRRDWGSRANLNFFIFFQAQAIFDILFSLPFLAVAFNASSQLGALDLIGAMIVAISIFGETTADRQLSRFRADPANRGKTCRQGLWRYSRHPNYFFEWIHWFAYPFLAYGSPYFWLSLLGPILMLVFLFKITGIPPTEARAVETRGEDYKNYQRTTSMFIPWFPKS